MVQNINPKHGICQQDLRHPGHAACSHCFSYTIGGEIGQHWSPKSTFMKNLGRYKDEITADFLEFTQWYAQSHKVIQLNSNPFACPSCYTFPTRPPLSRFHSDTLVSMLLYIFSNLFKRKWTLCYLCRQ